MVSELSEDIHSEGKGVRQSGQMWTWGRGGIFKATLDVHNLYHYTVSCDIYSCLMLLLLEMTFVCSGGKMQNA